MKINGYIIMNDRTEFYGPGGWGEKQNARIFCVEDALSMLKVFAPRASALYVVVEEPEPARTLELVAA